MTSRFAIVLIAAAMLLGGCATAYYSAMESVGFAKRDILASRVVAARDSQQAAKQEITDALTEFGKVVSYRGGDLEAQYKRLAAQLKDSESAAESVHTHIRDVESVAEALFDEWQKELGQYSSADLWAQSERQLRQTRARYAEMIGAMQRADSKLEPALQPLRDQVLFLKHNLNARAPPALADQLGKCLLKVAFDQGFAGRQIGGPDCPDLPRMDPDVALRSRQQAHILRQLEHGAIGPQYAMYAWSVPLTRPDRRPTVRPANAASKRAPWGGIAALPSRFADNSTPKSTMPVMSASYW